MRWFGGWWKKILIQGKRTRNEYMQRRRQKKKKTGSPEKKKRILYKEWANNLVPRALFPSNIWKVPWGNHTSYVPCILPRFHSSYFERLSTKYFNHDVFSMFRPLKFTCVWFTKPKFNRLNTNVLLFKIVVLLLKRKRFTFEKSYRSVTFRRPFCLTPNLYYFR